MKNKIKAIVITSALGITLGSAQYANAESGKQPGRILSLKGDVTIDGKPAKIGQEVPEGSRVETTTGAAVIAFGEDDVLKLSSDTKMKVESTMAGKIETVVEKGRVEGISRVDSSPRSAQVATPSGSMETTGGRYVVDVQGSGASFSAIDRPAEIRSSGNTPISLPMGERAVIGEGMPITREIASVSPAASPAPRSPSGSIMNSISVQPLIQPATNLNRDILQPVGRLPNVQVKFKY